MKKRPKRKIYEDYADTIIRLRQGKKPKRSRAKDGSIPTHPVIPVPILPESDVLELCVRWFKKKHIYMRRHDVGAGDFGYGYATYGIMGAGDLIGLLPNGIHLEIECKRGKGGRLSEVQQKHRQRIIDNNGIYLIIHGDEELEYLLKGIV